MSAEVRYRREITAELAARAEPEIDRLFQWWNERWHEVVRTRRRIPLRVIRWTGLCLSFVGIVIAGAGIVLTAEAPCRRGHPALFYDAVMPVFVVFATVFGFMERIAPALQRWSARMASRQGKRVAGKTRRAAPFTADYVVSANRLESRVEKLRLVRISDVRRVDSAAFAANVACLLGARGFLPLRRIVWLPEGAAREDLRDAFRAAGVNVVELAPDAGDTPDHHGPA